MNKNYWDQVPLSGKVGNSSHGLILSSCILDGPVIARGVEGITVRSIQWQCRVMGSQ